MTDLVVAVGQQCLPVGELTKVGWKLPDNLTENAWIDHGRQLEDVNQSRQWWLGDWWNAGVKWGKGQEACERLGIDYSHAMKCGSVARRIQFLRRRKNLAFAHHQEVCTLDDPGVQDRFLDWCSVDFETGEELGKPRSVRELRDAIREYLDEQGWTDSERERRDLARIGQAVLANQKADVHLVKWAQFEGVFLRIDRMSEWGNPFRCPEDGNRDTCCDHYGIYLEMKPSLLKKLDQLRGKVLACWCYPERCHGNEILKRL